MSTGINIQNDTSMGTSNFNDVMRAWDEMTTQDTTIQGNLAVMGAGTITQSSELNANNQRTTNREDLERLLDNLPLDHRQTVTAATGATPTGATPTPTLIVPDDMEATTATTTTNSISISDLYDGTTLSTTPSTVTQDYRYAQSESVEIMEKQINLLQGEVEVSRVKLYNATTEIEEMREEMRKMQDQLKLLLEV